MPGFQIRLLLLAAAVAVAWGLVYLLGARRLAAHEQDRRSDEGRVPQPEPTFPMHPPEFAKFELWAILAVMALAAVLRIPPLGRGLSVDELMTARHFVDVESTWTTVSTYYGFNNHIGYSLSARVSEAVFGRSEISLRLPALIFGLGGVFLTWVVGRRLIGTGVAVASALLLAISSAHIGVSTTARGYAGLVCLGLLTTYLFLEYLRRPARTTLLGFVLTSAFMLWVHMHGVLVLATQALILAAFAVWPDRWHPPKWRPPVRSFRSLWRGFLAIGTLAAILYAPVAGQLINNLEDRAALLGGSDFRGQLLPVLKYLASTDAVIAWVALGLASAGLLALWRRRPVSGSFVTVLLLLVVVDGLGPGAKLRFFDLALPLYAWICMGGLDAMRRAALGVAGGPGSTVVNSTFAVCATALTVAWAAHPYAATPRSGIRDAMRVLEAQGDADVGVCALGTRVGLYDYYATGDVFSPASWGEFRRFKEEHREIRCICRCRWDRIEDPLLYRITTWLKENGSMETFRTISVFTYPARDRPDPRESR